MSKWMVEYKWVRKPELVTVVSETEKTWTQEYVDYRGKKETRRRMHGTSPLFDTFESAKSYLIELKIKEIESSRRHLEKLNGELGNLKGLKE